MDWKVSKEEQESLRSLTNSKGWRVLQGKQKMLLEDAKEWALSADNEKDFQLRKGFLQGLTQAFSLADNLDRMADSDEKKEMARRLELEFESLLSERGGIGALMSEGRDI